MWKLHHYGLGNIKIFVDQHKHTWIKFTIMVVRDLQNFEVSIIKKHNSVCEIEC